MDLYNYFLILLIVLLSILISFYIYNTYFNDNLLKESFGFNGLDNEYDIISKNDVDTQIQSIRDYNIKLSQVVIKGAYNTAFTGTYMNTEMIKYVLSRGCRYLDFEIFFIKEDDIFIPVVAVSDDPTFSTLKSENYLKLNDVLTTIISNAFSFTSPNRLDPLIVNLRIKSNDSNIYSNIAKLLDYHFKDYLFNDKIHENTTLNDIKGKIVLSVDKTIHRNYKDYNDCNDPNKKCIKLKHFVNIESGGEFLNKLRYTDIFAQNDVSILIKDDNINTNIKHMKLIEPDLINDSLKNPSINDLVIKYASQIVPFCFYKKDLQLDLYEELYNDNFSAFVPLGVAIPYFKKKNE